MINRREALLGLSAAVLSSAAPQASALGEVFGPGLPISHDDLTAAKPGDTPDEIADERLRKDLAGMANRANSEEGVPVLLACVNLLKDPSSNKVPPVRLTAMNKAVTTEFRTTAAAWKRIKPNSEEGDVGSLIQVLAARDFASGGKGGQS
jgi:hypothetical protein